MHFLDDFAKIDLNRAWLAPYLPIHHAFATTGNLPLYEWLNGYFKEHHIYPKNTQDQPLTFTHQNDLPHGIAYETHIGTHHKIPTRDNLHDWFGACVWSVFPKSKALLNTKHLAHLNDDNSANKRNRVRDAITVFDENGAIVVVSDETLGGEIAQALANFDWQTCLVKHRQHWHTPNHLNNPNSPQHTKAQVFVFGHALLEQLISPYKSLCSHTLTLPVPPPFFEMDLSRQLAFLDNFLCYYLNGFLTDDVTPRDLQPLPILGVPHFWDNGDPTFYEDSFVFRSGRKEKTKGVLVCTKSH